VSSEIIASDPRVQASVLTLYQLKFSLSEIARQLSISRNSVHRSLKILGVRVAKKHKKKWIPSPEEVESRMREVRSTWSVNEYRRRNRASPTPVQVPMVIREHPRPKPKGANDN
jgi:hypothetical protein